MTYTDTQCNAMCNGSNVTAPMSLSSEYLRFHSRIFFFLMNAKGFTNENLRWLATVMHVLKFICPYDINLPATCHLSAPTLLLFVVMVDAVLLHICAAHAHSFWIFNSSETAIIIHIHRGSSAPFPMRMAFIVRSLHYTPHRDIMYIYVIPSCKHTVDGVCTMNNKKIIIPRTKQQQKGWERDRPKEWVSEWPQTSFTLMLRTRTAYA